MANVKYWIDLSEEEERQLGKFISRGKVNLTNEFGDYLEQLSEGLGRTARKVGLINYCSGLMLPLKHKSIEPLAGSLDPCHVPSLHHLIADFPWADESVLGRLRSCVLPRMG